jgi:glycosyltransferase involved in cell wall biosynthesis
MAPAISITVPVYNEVDSIRPLVDAVRQTMKSWQDDWELVFVDDGSEDGSAAVVESEADSDPRIRLVRLARNNGQSPAMQAGFDHSLGDVIVTMDGDLQNDPQDIRALVLKLDEGFDLVAGYRERRKDMLLSRRIPSWLGYAFVRRAAGVSIRDTGCTLKAFRRQLLDRLRLYSDFHRFIPALAVSIAGARIVELPVRHHPRKFGRSKYGVSRVTKVLADLLTLAMLRRFREHPLRMFAVGATISFVLASVTSIVALLAAWDIFDSGAVVVLAAIATCWLALSGFLVMTGFIGEGFLHLEKDNDPVEVILLHPVRS